jgi:hypothetical protein
VVVDLTTAYEQTVETHFENAPAWTPAALRARAEGQTSARIPEAQAGNRPASLAAFIFDKLSWVGADAAHALLLTAFINPRIIPQLATIVSENGTILLALCAAL